MRVLCEQINNYELEMFFANFDGFVLKAKYINNIKNVMNY